MSSPAVESFLDDLFAKHAADRLAYSKDKLFTYRLLDDNYYSVKKTGRCHLIGCRYDRGLDCEVLTIKDIDTNETITDHQFKIDLILITE